MGMNPNYEAIGKSFIQQYYAMLDSNETRLQVANFYSVSLSGLLLPSVLLTIVLFYSGNTIPNDI